MHIWFDIMVVGFAVLLVTIALTNRGPTTVNIPHDILLHQKIDLLERRLAARMQTERYEGEMIQRIFERTKDGLQVTIRSEIPTINVSEMK